MTHLLFLIPLSIGMGLIGLAAFFWALHNNQFEDPQGDAARILTMNDADEVRTPQRDGRPDGPDSHDP